MSPSRLVFVIVTAGCLLVPMLVRAQDTSTLPVGMAKQYSTDLLIGKPDGTTTPSKTYVDGDKIRNEMNINGLDIVQIVRRDLHQIYQLVPNQKMAVQMAYNPGQFKNAGSAMGPEGKFEPIGQEVVDGVACTKYKVTSDKTKQIFYYWLDRTRNTPVQMTTANNSITVKWKNFKVGPQPAALFEIPADYQNITNRVPAMQPQPYRPNTPPSGTPGAPQNPGQPPATNSGSAAQ